MELNELLEQVNELKAEIDALRPIDAAQERRIMQKFRLDWTFHSNAIEGNRLTYGETRAFLLHGITAQGKPFRDYLDIKGHHAAIDFLLAFVRREEPLTEADVRELHKVILVEPYQVDARTPDGQLTKRTIQPGQYKTMPNHVETSTGEIHYYAIPEETPAKMADLMAWYRREVDKGELHPLILAATFHYQFVVIHPFDDGNGRMARLLMNLIFMQAGFPPVIVRTEDKNNYLLALEQADTGDLEPFIVHIGNELLNSLNLFLRGAKGEDIEEFEDLDKKIAILEKKLDATRQTKGPEKSRETLGDFYDSWLDPFLDSFYYQIGKFDRFFQKHTLDLSAHQMRQKDIELSKLKVLAKEALLSQAKSDEELQIVYKFENFKTDVSFKVFIILYLNLRQFNFEIKYQLFPHVSLANPLVNERYDVSFSKKHVDDLFLQIGKDFYEIIERKAD